MHVQRGLSNILVVSYGPAQARASSGVKVQTRGITTQPGGAEFGLRFKNMINESTDRDQRILSRPRNLPGGRLQAHIS